MLLLSWRHIWYFFPMRTLIVQTVAMFFLAATVLLRAEVAAASNNSHGSLGNQSPVHIIAESLIAQVQSHNVGNPSPDVSDASDVSGECACELSKSSQSFFSCGIAMGLPINALQLSSRFAQRTRSVIPDDTAGSISPDILKRPPRLA